MKLKYILIVSLVLTIITLGAVSASEDIASDDELAVDGGVDDSVVAIDNSDQIASEENSEDTLEDAQGDGWESEIKNVVVPYGADDSTGEVVYYSSENTTITGNFVVKVNDTEKYSQNIISSDYEPEDYIAIELRAKALGIANGGSYKISLYLNDNLLDEEDIKVTLGEFEPDVTDIIDMGVNSEADITISTLNNGNQVARLYDENNVLVAEIQVINGKGKYSLSSSKMSLGRHDYTLEYPVGDKIRNSTIEITVYENSKEFSSTVTPSQIITGNTVTVNVVGPESIYTFVSIFDNGNVLNHVEMKAGKLNEVLSGLSIGTHNIKVKLQSDGYFYERTHTVTVKPVPVTPAKKVTKITLTLKKVTVKKSAKKLTIQATLKVNGKAPKKGTKIKFKFKGKSYTGKTNSKGVAKITVKKSVLKKLKKGKKVTYTATYGKVTKKVTVKVKK